MTGFHQLVLHDMNNNSLIYEEIQSQRRMSLDGAGQS
jgi:hypothetical protein